ncbi:MAG: hypothetical protein ACE15E_16980 [Acidobacteriota bacterium]
MRYLSGGRHRLYAGHRVSTDAEPLTDLRERFDAVLTELESVAGWRTARIRRPVQILGSLDGIETGVPQPIRDEPLETTQVECFGQRVTVPTQAEMLRIKAVLILSRNATRDYLDSAALPDHIGDDPSRGGATQLRLALPATDRGIGLQQLQVQLANATRLPKAARSRSLAP